MLRSDGINTTRKRLYGTDSSPNESIGSRLATVDTAPQAAVGAELWARKAVSGDAAISGNGSVAEARAGTVRSHRNCRE